MVYLVGYMKIYKTILICIGVLLKLNTQAQTGQPFTCNGEMYITFYSDVGGNTDFFTISTAPLTTTPVGSILQNYNCIGYNPVDNFIYGIDPYSHTLFRIDNTGSPENLGTLSLPNDIFVAGDCAANGDYIITSAHESDYIVTVDLNTLSTSVVNKYYADGSLGLPAFGDIAFDFQTNICYGFDNFSHSMATINYQIGAVAPFGPSYPDIPNIGALFFDADGNLFGYGANAATTQNINLYGINTTTGTVTLLEQGPVFLGTDGCSCQVVEDACLPNISGDETICENGNGTLDAGGEFLTYEWNSGETTQSIVVSQAGEYCVTVTDSTGCTGSDCWTVISSTTVLREINYNGCIGDGYEVVVNNITYNEVNPVGVETLTSVANCDSIVNINLNFNANNCEYSQNIVIPIFLRITMESMIF